MPFAQILILGGLFAAAMGGWFFLKKRSKLNGWVQVNVLLIIVGVAGACAITPFLIPHNFLRNLAVFTILPLVSYNIFYLLDQLTARWLTNKLLRELTGFLSIFFGILAGAGIVNWIGLSVFNRNDIKDTLIIAFIFNTARMLLHYLTLSQLFRKKGEDMVAIQVREAETAAQLALLESRLNPHFLYNSLNSIAALAMVDGRKTKEMTIALSKLLRFSLNYTGSKYATVREEITMAETYLAIERIRFGEKLRCEISVAEGLDKYLIPRFMLQPLIENCIKHGFHNPAEGNLIRIDVTKENSELVISVRDNGLPFPEQLVPGYGLKNIKDKLTLLLPGNHDLEISNAPEKAVKIVIRNPTTNPA